MTSISAILLKQKIRNRLIEYFDLSYEEIARWGTSELICCWEGYVPNGWDEEFFDAPVFSAREAECIRQFCLTWERTSDLTKTDHFDAEELRTIPHWVVFMEEAKKGLALFSERGKFPDDIEISDWSQHNQL